MKYHVLSHTAYRRTGRATTALISWQVVDVESGLNEMAYPRIVIATCRDEGNARQIADMFNGVNRHAEHWQAEADQIRKERDEARESSKANGAEAERARETIALVRRHRDDLIATERNLRHEAGKLLEELAEIKRNRGLHHLRADILRDQLIEAREERDEARDILKHGVLGADCAPTTANSAAQLLADIEDVLKLYSILPNL